MSAINTLTQKDSVHLMTDGLSYLNGVPVEVNLRKAHLIPGMRAAISCTGPAALVNFVVERVEGRFASFDDLVANGSAYIRELFREHVTVCRHGDDASSVALIGWHEHDNRPAAYGMDMNIGSEQAEWICKNNPNSRKEDVCPDLSEQPIMAVPCPTPEELKAAHFDMTRDFNSMDSATDLLHVLQIQRQKRYSDGNFYVGGHALLTTVTADGVTQRIVHLWDEDRPGVKIVPAPIDWATWRVERETLPACRGYSDDVAVGARTTTSG